MNDCAAVMVWKWVHCGNRMNSGVLKGHGAISTVNTCFSLSLLVTGLSWHLLFLHYEGFERFPLLCYVGVAPPPSFILWQRALLLQTLQQTIIEHKLSDGGHY